MLLPPPRLCCNAVNSTSRLLHGILGSPHHTEYLVVQRPANFPVFLHNMWAISTIYILRSRTILS